VTGQLVAAGDFTGFDAAHIVPLSETDIVRGLPRAYTNYFLIFIHFKWNEQNFKRFIQDDQIEVNHELNSVQQGFLCSTTEHRMFDDYSIAVNPDVCIELSSEPILLTAYLG